MKKAKKQEKKIDRWGEESVSLRWIACGINTRPPKSESNSATLLQQKIMKMTTFKILAIALGLSGSVFGQANPAVVGFETLSLSGSTFNLVGVRLHGKVVDSGTFDSSTSTTLTDSSADFSALSGNYVIEYADGTSISFTDSDASTGTISNLSGID
ncbi:MAG: hypothetical protein AAGC74_06140, partial [Verrucomicrobiota bacterium]